jgi:hypothetical protein
LKIPHRERPKPVANGARPINVFIPLEAGADNKWWCIVVRLSTERWDRLAAPVLDRLQRQASREILQLAMSEPVLSPRVDHGRRTMLFCHVPEHDSGCKADGGQQRVWILRPAPLLETNVSSRLIRSLQCPQIKWG